MLPAHFFAPGPVKKAGVSPLMSDGRIMTTCDDAAFPVISALPNGVSSFVMLTMRKNYIHNGL